MATVKNSLLEKIRKNSSIKETEILTKSKFFTKKDMIKTSIPAINIALSGEVDGGFIPGLTLWAGPSKHGKTFFSLLMAKAYMDKYPEAVLILLDCEFGSPLQYFTSIGIDTDRVVHIPIMNMEEFKFEVLQQLTNFERGDKVILMVDSLGNMASKKEVDDAVDGKSTQDMTRARQMKSIFRMITPYLTRLDIPMVAVAHIYMSQETFSKPVVSGGCLVPGSKIKLSDGSSIAIEDVEVGMQVATLNGPHEVTRTWNPETLAVGEPECYEITFDDGTSVICSDTHEFLIAGEWVEAKDIVLNSDVTVHSL